MLLTSALNSQALVSGEVSNYTCIIAVISLSGSAMEKPELLPLGGFNHGSITIVHGNSGPGGRAGHPFFVNIKYEAYKKTMLCKARPDVPEAMS